MKLLSIIPVTAFAMVLFSCAKPGSLSDTELLALQEKPSIKLENGHYRIDTFFIRQYKNKQSILTELKKQKLVDKHKVSDIPEFLVSFLNDVSGNRNFDIADPGQKWKAPDITNFATSSLVARAEEKTPNKQLVYFGISRNFALLSYYHGDCTMRQNMVIIKFKDQEVVDLWYENISLTAQNKGEILKQLERFPRGGGC